MTNPTNDGRGRRVSILDTTLRDGEQAPGNAMTADQKLAIGLSLEALGVDAIEGGFPASSPSDFRAAQLLSQHLTTARLTSFARAVRRDVEVAAEAAGTRNHQIQILATGSDFHLTHKRGIDRATLLAEVRDTAAFAAECGFTDIAIGIEDASRGEPDLLRGIIETGLEVGATTMGVADTSGCLTPAETGELVHLVRSWMPASVTFAIHCHDDLGLGVANALAGIEAGADEVQVTLAGIGERAGNTALEELAAVLLYRGSRFGAYTTIRTEKLAEAYQVLAEAIELDTPRNKAIFGASAFATQAGIHQAGMLRNPETYEYIDPKKFGREREILIGRHSGTAIIKYLLDELGLGGERQLLAELYEEFVINHSARHCMTLDEVRQIFRARFAAPVPVGAKEES